MAITSTTVAVGVSATPLSNPEGDHVGGQSVAVAVPDGATVFVGAGDVTTSTGFPVTGSFEVDLDKGETLYGVAASAVTVNVLRQGA